MPSTQKTLDYSYTQTGPTWDHGIVLPPIFRVAQAIPRDGAILDIGCGNGVVLAELRRIGAWKLCGVETSSSGVAVAARDGLDVRLSDGNGDLVEMFGPSSFDLIISVEVIEHVYDPRSLLRQAHALLRPKGRLLLTTPYHGYLKNLMIAALGQCDSHYNPLWDCGHIKFFSRRTLSAMLVENGFQDLQFCGVGRLKYLWKSMVLTASAR